MKTSKWLNTRKMIEFKTIKSIKGSPLDVFPYRAQCTVTLNSNFAILKKKKKKKKKKTEIVFNWNKRIIWACRFVEKKKKKRRRVFALFKSIFLRHIQMDIWISYAAFDISTFYSTARRFYGKDAKLGRKICI